ncbi:phospholipase A and acyltransferase 3-like [Haliotis asinina]|uniref:phospholipase A and acyltransferase 3-like n=1 Tax=Haliotis asinina TaxID=109174 RepID=UPI0035326DFE
MATIEDHNEAVLSSLEPGDQVEFKGPHFNHWAVYIGDGFVIHLTSADGQSSSKTDKAIIRQDKIGDAANNRKMTKNNGKGEKYGLRPFSKSEIVERAKSQLGRKGYNLIARNCEHFVSWCCYDFEISDQVKEWTEIVAEMIANWIEERRNLEGL